MDRKTIFGIIGTIILGALGSGLWELGKPIAQGAWTAVLTVATLGLDSLRDGIYVDAGRLGGIAARQVAMGQLLTALMFVLTAGIMMRLRFLPAEPGRVVGRFVYYLPYVLLGCSLAAGVAGTRTQYVSRVATYFEQLQVIASPLLHEKERYRVVSLAAAATNRSEYLAAISELQSIMDAHNTKYPKWKMY